MKLKLLKTDNTDIYSNQALEKLLFDRAVRGEITLFLWQNENAVVIGKNQDAESECRIRELTADGGRLARRISGGGAVYHDMGNLNFTFIAADGDYSVSRQLSVITAALKNLGINAAVTGRNDIEIDGRKFSGNAFYHSGGFSLHHGTIIVSCSPEKIERYLTPDADKLKARGVGSVRARVGSLCEIIPAITAAKVERALCDAFCEEYGGRATALKESELMPTAKTRAAEFSDEGWIMRTAGGEAAVKTRFSWGGFALKIKSEQSRVAVAVISTDSLETEIFKRLENALVGAPAKLSDMADAVLTVEPHKQTESVIIKDIGGFLKASDGSGI